ncbi:unnamed protein product [Penicillium salamii]|nr:unnamed protein product [Penicillium salamii]
MTYVGEYGDHLLYPYTPSLIAAGIFFVLFLLTTMYHVYQLLANQSWYLLLLAVGGFCKRFSTSASTRPEKCIVVVPLTFFIPVQMIGYVERAIAHSNPEVARIYSLQAIFILLAPAVFAGSIYMALEKLVLHLHAEEFSMLPLGWMTAIFMNTAMVAFLLQATGSGIMANGKTDDVMTIGRHIVMGGLCVQLVFFALFILSLVIFYQRYRTHAPARQAVEARRTNLLHITHTWVTTLIGLYSASALILVRSTFRLIQYAQGPYGSLLSDEAFLYIFDALLMFIAMLVMNVFHPSMVLSPQRRTDSFSLRTLGVLS